MSRRLVAVLFLDLVAWTETAERVDPEPLQQFLERYYETCVAAVDRHGGIVEKFIGDAIMAVFGAERSREDDALRALRAAFEVRAGVAELTIAGLGSAAPRVHCGVAAGEALVTTSAHAGVRIVGDVVNLAARLQSAAPPDEILINEVMAHLVRTRAEVEPVPSLKLKGKAGMVPAWRTIGLATDLPETRTATPMVDRDDEAAFLREAYEAVVRTRRARAVLVLGPSGIGKTRLAREFVAQIPAPAPPVTAFATCPSYGASESLDALGQIVELLLEEPEVARAVSGVRDGRALEVLRRLGDPALAGGGGQGGPDPGVEEISWAVRELLAAAAGTGPLVLVWDDLHWASAASRGIIAEVAARLSELPVLIIGLARWTPAEVSTHAAAGALPWRVLPLAPLPRPDTIELVALLAADFQADVVAHDMQVLDRVVDQSGGNPLFAELMTETVALGSSGDEIPPTVTALLGALLDRLPAESLRILETASVVGTTFLREQLAALAEPARAAESASVAEPASTTGLDDLVRRQLIVPGARAGEYRFGQQLLHEVVYGRIVKQRRLALHRQLADHGVAPEFHLEATVRLMQELRPDEPGLTALAIRAADALLADGTRALRRRDIAAAVDLLRRALEMRAGDDDARRTVAMVRLSDALLLAGELGGALAAVEEGVGSPVAPLRHACQIQRSILAVRSGHVGESRAGALLAELRPAADDHMSWCRHHQLQMLVHLGDGQFGAAEDSARNALQRAEAMNDHYERDRLMAALCEIGQWSPTPIREKLASCRELAARFASDRCLLVPVLVAQARSLALAGDLAQARQALARSREIVTDLRLAMAGALVDQGDGVVASLAGEGRRAERHFRAAARALDAAGHRPAALALRVLAVRERLRWRPGPQVADDVRALAQQAEQMDVRGQVLAAAAVARVAADGGGDEFSGAAAALLAQVQRTDDPCLRGDAFADLAFAHERRGDRVRARELAAAARDSYATVGATLPRQGVQA